MGLIILCNLQPWVQPTLPSESKGWECSWRELSNRLCQLSQRQSPSLRASPLGAAGLLSASRTAWPSRCSGSLKVVGRAPGGSPHIPVSAVCPQPVALPGRDPYCWEWNWRWGSQGRQTQGTSITIIWNGCHYRAPGSVPGSMLDPYLSPRTGFS